MKNNLNISPLSSAIARITDNIVYMPLHGGGTVTIGVTAVTVGYPTVLTLGGSLGAISGQKVKISGIVGMTQLNGYFKVISNMTTTLVLDVDSTNFSTYTSGGTVLSAVIADTFNKIAPIDVQGVLTGIWGAPQNGITAHASGTNSLLLTSGVDVFNCAGFAGIVCIAMSVKITASPSAAENIFTIGLKSGSGTNTKSGTLNVSIEPAGYVQLVGRPRTAADSAGTNLFINTTAIGNGTKRNIAFLVDMRDSINSVPVYVYMDGVLKATGIFTLTSSTGMPDVSQGVAFGAAINSSAGLINKLGSGGSGATVEKFLFWKSTKTLTNTIGAMFDYMKNGEPNPGMI